MSADPFPQAQNSAATVSATSSRIERMIELLDRDRVSDLDPRRALAAAAAARRSADRSEADLLVLAAHVADLHPVAGTADTQTGSATVLGREGALQLAGEGTPSVAEFACEELAVVLGISSDAARQLVGEALELRHRLPRLWALVLDGRLQPWRARQVASETTALSRVCAGFVDRHLAVAAARNRVPRLKSLVHEALLQHDPDAAAGREQAALDQRGVWADHRESTATSRVTIVADTHDALSFDDSVSDVARMLGLLGDQDALDTRRARAVGILADPQSSLDLLAGRVPGSPRRDTTALSTDTTAIPAAAASSAADRADGSSVLAARPARPTTLYLHLPSGTSHAMAERQGLLTLRLLREWIGRSSRVTLRPVIDLAGTCAEGPATLDGHEPPAWMRELVVLRDPSCVFPGCGRTSRACDVDHIEPYVAPEAGGGADQTRPEALAPLCRRHHRVKTHGSWRYRRDPDGSYVWTGPHGDTWTVEASGTRHPPAGRPGAAA